MSAIYLTNVSQLATNFGAEGDIAIVAQLYVGGIFIYRVASTLVNDGGTVASSSSTGKWIRQERELGNPFNVLWFGAIPDGSINYTNSSATGTDNTTAFNNATLAATTYDDAGLMSQRGFHSIHLQL